MRSSHSGWELSRWAHGVAALASHKKLAFSNLADNSETVSVRQPNLPCPGMNTHETSSISVINR